MQTTALLHRRRRDAALLQQQTAQPLQSMRGVLDERFLDSRAILLVCLAVVTQRRAPQPFRHRRQPRQRYVLPATLVYFLRPHRGLTASHGLGIYRVPVRQPHPLPPILTKGPGTTREKAAAKLVHLQPSYYHEAIYERL